MSKQLNTFDLLQAEDVRTYDIFEYIDYVIEQKGDVPLSLFRKFLAEEIDVSNEPHNEGLEYKHQFIVTEHISPPPNDKEIAKSERKHKEYIKSIGGYGQSLKQMLAGIEKQSESEISRFKYTKYERDNNWPD